MRETNAGGLGLAGSTVTEMSLAWVVDKGGGDKGGDLGAEVEA